MDVYRQAADVVTKVREGNGTAKALCLEKSMQKKKQTYAVVCETLRRYAAIEKILEQAQFFHFYPLVDKHLAMVLTYDMCFGMGVRTKQHQAAVAIHESQQYLQQAFSIVSREDPSILVKYKLEPLDNETELPSTVRDAPVDPSARLPTYVRVNTLAANTTLESVLHYFKKRNRTGDDCDEQKDDEANVAGVKRDPHVPDLLVLPPKTDLHKSSLLRTGQIVIQDKASCIPPCVLLGSVPVVAPEGSQFGPAPKRVVDACSAPGNKTTQLAALGNPMVKEGIRIVACEMDARRASILRDRVKFLHGDEQITVMEGDFMTLENKHRSRAEAVLVDPSCSASGMVKRVDVTFSTATEDEKTKRVEMLARMQQKLLTSALTCFPRARRVVYSTCSIHERENEEVVRRVLNDADVASYWALANIMPDTWTTRGLPSAADESGTTHTTEFCIRCDPEKDRTNGFFVACFDRVAAAPPQA
jgi:putative methyltransferase